MAKKKKSKDQEFICPECNGEGFIEDTFNKCFLCLGTGLATDDDSFEHLYHYEDDWRG